METAESRMKVLILLCALGALTACATSRCPAEKPWIRVVHLSEGDGPLVTILELTRDGSSSVAELHGKMRCKTVDSDLSALKGAVENPETMVGLREADAAWEKSGHHSEQMEIQIGAQEYRVSVEAIPPELDVLLAQLQRPSHRLSDATSGLT